MASIPKGAQIKAYQARVAELEYDVKVLKQKQRHEPPPSGAAPKPGSVKARVAAVGSKAAAAAATAATPAVPPYPPLEAAVPSEPKRALVSAPAPAPTPMPVPVPVNGSADGSMDDSVSVPTAHGALLEPNSEQDSTQDSESKQHLSSNSTGDSERGSLMSRLVMNQMKDMRNDMARMEEVRQLWDLKSVRPLYRYSTIASRAPGDTATTLAVEP